MPTFQGLVSEEGVLQLIEYIKSLNPEPKALGQSRDRQGAVRRP
jgi:hypothetical protein